MRARFNISIRKIGEVDTWQRSVLGLCMIHKDKNCAAGHWEAVLSLVPNVDEILIRKYRLDFLS